MKSEPSNCSLCSLKSCSVGTLTTNELTILTRMSSPANFKKGEMIFKEGTPNDQVIYLREGFVKLPMSIREGKEFIIKIVAPPSYLGLLTFFGDDIHRYSAIAIEPSRVCFIDKHIFRTFIRENGNFALAIINHICNENLYDLRRLVYQQHHQLPGRIAGILLYFADDIYKTNRFELPLTHCEIGELIGASRENVNRTLHQFNQDRLIEMEGHNIIIRKMTDLKRIRLTG